MKKLYLLLSLALVASAASARQISESEARTIAISKVPSVRQAPVRVYKASENFAQPAPGRVQACAETCAPIYVFHAEQGGFAIVAGDDRMPSMLLAYSDNSRLDPDNYPPAMKAWLDDMARLISAGNFAKIHREQSLDYSNPVSPLISTKWDQDEPYNRLTPLGSTGQHCPTGCPATAMSQLMNYWQFPQEGGLAAHSYEWNGQTLTVDFRESRYDWENMADIYDENSTEAQCNAVAKLMWDCGVACDMKYGDDSSGSFIGVVARGLVDLMGYNPGLRIRYRDFMTTDEWFAMVKSELEASRPVYYIGATPSEEGHAFICDGYDTSGLFHINWGWSGVSDGYFDLTTLDPDTQGTGGAASGNGFSIQQAIISDLRPAQAEDVAANGWELMIADFDLEPNDAATAFDVLWEVFNQGYRPFAGTINLVLAREGHPEDVEEMVLQEIPTEEQLYYNEGVNMGLQNIDITDLEDGLYRLQLVAYAQGSEEPVEVIQANISLPMRFEISQGKISFETRPTLAITDGELDDLNFFYTTEEGLRANLSQLTFTAANTSDVWFLGLLGLQVTYPDMSGASVTETCTIADTPYLGPGEACEFTIPFRYNVSGNVKVEVVSVGDGENDAQETLFQDNTVDFAAENSYHELELVDMPKVTEADGKVTLSVEVNNCTGSVEMEDGCAIHDSESQTEKEVYCYLYKEDPKHLITTLSQTYSGKWNESKTLVFSTPEPLENGEYSAVLTYQSEPDHQGSKLDLNLGEESEGWPGIHFAVTTASVDNLLNEADSAITRIYSVCGQSMSLTDTLAPGCYIVVRGGKASKILVK